MLFSCANQPKGSLLHVTVTVVLALVVIGVVLVVVALHDIVVAHSIFWFIVVEVVVLAIAPFL